MRAVLLFTWLGVFFFKKPKLNLVVVRGLTPMDFRMALPTDRDQEPGIGSGNRAARGPLNLCSTAHCAGLLPRRPNYCRLGGGKLGFCPYFRCHSSRSSTGGASTNAADVAYGSRTGHLALCSMSGFRLMTQHAQIAECKYCRPHARPFHLRFARVVAVLPPCPLAPP